MRYWMDLQNFNNREEENRQLYRIRYGYGDQPKEVHLLASGFVDALEASGYVVNHFEDPIQALESLNRTPSRNGRALWMPKGSLIGMLI